MRNFYGGSDEGVYDDGDQVEVGEPPVLKLLTEVLDAHLGAGGVGGRWSQVEPPQPKHPNCLSGASFAVIFFSGTFCVHLTNFEFCVVLNNSV